MLNANRLKTEWNKTHCEKRTVITEKSKSKKRDKTD